MASVAPFSTTRVAARMANGFALDLIKLGSLGRDVVDTLILNAIAQANVRLITSDPSQQLRFATLDQVPPDDLRRPVSVSAVANSLQMSFETVRRRVAAMAAEGIVIIGPKGVIVPQAPLDSPFYRMAMAALEALTRTLYFRLRDIGALTNLKPPPAGRAAWVEPPHRIIGRLTTDYVLRLSEPLTLHVGDLVTGIVLMDMVSANTEGFTDDEGGGDDSGAEAFIADALRRPVRVSALARRLGLPEETVRRHVAKIVATERAVKTPTGYLVPASVLARPDFVAFMVTNRLQLERLFNSLSELGVLADWDRQRNAP